MVKPNSQGMLLKNVKSISIYLSVCPSVSVIQVSPPSRRCCGLLPARAAEPKQILSNGELLTLPSSLSCSACGLVRPGEFLAIMGASGAGKSTLMNTLLFRNLAGLEVSGKRMANGEPVTPSSLLAVSGYVQQDDLFFGEHLTFEL